MQAGQASLKDHAMMGLVPQARDVISFGSFSLVAQAMVEGITLLTSDPVVAHYPGPVRAI